MLARRAASQFTPHPASPVTPHAGAAAPLLALLLNAAVWGLSWWPLRQLNALGLHPLWATALFFALGVVLMLAWRPRGVLELCSSPELWVLALASGLTNAAFNWAVSVGEVVRVVLLFYLMPLWAVGLAWALLGERVDRAGALRVALGLVGAVLVLRPEGGLSAQAWAAVRLPDVLGVLGGIGFAFTNVWLRRLQARSSSARGLAMFVGGSLLPAALAAALAAHGTLPWWPAPAPAWMLGALAMGGVFVGANLALQYGASKLPVNTASVVMLTEIVFAAGSAVWLGGETLRPMVLLGGVCIVGSAVLAAWQRWAEA